MSTALDDFVAAAPQPMRSGMRALTALGRRPRGMWLLERLPPVDQLANGLLVAERFEEPAASVPLGWDAAAVAARGRALRREEGRP